MSAPTGIKILSVLYYIGAVILVLLGIAMLVGAGFVGSLVPEFGAIGGGILAFVGIIVIVLAAVEFFIARGLWKGQSWARILTIIFSILGVLSGLLSLVQGVWTAIIGLIINGLIAWYLIWNKKVKKHFA